MAILRNQLTGADMTLHGRTLIGRSPRADVRLIGEAASNEHASICWDGDDWILRDLTSRNGTKLNGTLLIGRQWRLAAGDEIVFGDPQERWCWVDGAAPHAVAVRDDGVKVDAINGLLVLPEQGAPRASIYARDDQWEMDLTGTTRRVEDGEALDLDGRRFRLLLPSPQPTAYRTRTFTEDGNVLAARAVFRHSLNEEHVELALQTRGGDKRLAGRAIYYMLLVLARARLRDNAAGVPSGEAGWVYTDDLAAMLKATAQQINVDVHRVRDVIAGTGLFTNPADIVERRRGSGQLRFGVGNVVVVRDGGKE
jgi:FHA domain